MTTLECNVCIQIRHVGATAPALHLFWHWEKVLHLVWIACNAVLLLLLLCTTIWLETRVIREQPFKIYLHWYEENWNGMEYFNRPHPLGMTKDGPFWYLSSLPISLHYINEVISCDVAAQSHIGIVDLILWQDTLDSFTIQFALCALKKEENTRQRDSGMRYMQ